MNLWPDIQAALDGTILVRHAVLTFGGTWGVPGTGYTSWVTQDAINQGAPLYEVPVQGPYTFGPVPGPPVPGGGISAPSYRESVNIAVEWAISWLLTHPKQTFLMAGYSLGGEAASRVLMEILKSDGRLHHLEENFIGGFTVGNPSREKNHSYPGGKDLGNTQGISSFHLTGTPDTWNDYANTVPGPDIYTINPDDEVGDVVEAAYDLGIDLQLHDMMGFFTAMLKHILKLADEAGLELKIPNLLKLGTSAFLGLAVALIPSLSKLVGTDDETSAAVQAAIRGLKFIASAPPTAPHITYEFALATNGQTFLQHAVGHVIDLSVRTPARAAA